MFGELRRLISRLSARDTGVRPGLYHYARETATGMARFHLRVDPAGDGLLMANAAAMARLSPSGVVIAKGLLEKHEPAAIVGRASSLFRGAAAGQTAADVAAVEALIKRMELPGNTYPIYNLDDPAFSPKVRPLARPISADVPLCPPFHMRQILDRLWQLGIPHVTIIVGRDSDESALIRAVERASDLGMIAGVRGRGTDFGQHACIGDLAAAGVDHLDIYCLSEHEAVHDALAGTGDYKKAVRALALSLKNEVCPVAQVALVRPTLTTIDQTLAGMSEHGLENVCLFAVATLDPAEASAGALLAHELAPAAQMVEEAAERCGVRLLWYPSVRFDPRKPLGEQVCRGPRCSGDTAVRVEPDGAVFAPRGPFRAAGNLITDDWETLEQSPVYQAYRRRVESDTHCDACPGLVICAADCPREPAGWADAESG